MKAFVRLLAALAFTIPVYLALANSPLNDWFLSGAGWQAFELLLAGFHTLGIDGEGNILIGTMLVVSFLIAVMLVEAGARLFHRATRETQP